MITKEDKQKALAKTQRSKKDVGSSEAQAAVLTARIQELIDHLETNPKDHAARRGLVQIVGRRKKLLKYLERTDYDLYRKTITALELRK